MYGPQEILEKLSMALEMNMKRCGWLGGWSEPVLCPILSGICVILEGSGQDHTMLSYVRKTRLVERLLEYTHTKQVQSTTTQELILQLCTIVDASEFSSPSKTQSEIATCVETPRIETGKNLISAHTTVLADDTRPPSFPGPAEAQRKHRFVKIGPVLPKHSELESDTLLSAVDRYGHNWKDILNLYRFDDSRTEVQLKDMYRTLRYVNFHV